MSRKETKKATNARTAADTATVDAEINQQTQSIAANPNWPRRSLLRGIASTYWRR